MKTNKNLKKKAIKPSIEPAAEETLKALLNRMEKIML